jgi:hypothetical protein
VSWQIVAAIARASVANGFSLANNSFSCRTPGGCRIIRVRCRTDGKAVAPAKRVLLIVLLMLCFATITSAPSPAGEITDAVKSRDVVRVRNLLASGADVNEKIRGDYPINSAAVFGPAEMVTTLLEAGAGLEQPGRDGLHPLHNAAISGRKEITVSFTPVRKLSIFALVSLIFAIRTPFATWTAHR